MEMSGHEWKIALIRDEEIQRLKNQLTMQDQEIRRLKMIIESAGLGNVFTNLESGYIYEIKKPLSLVSIENKFGADPVEATLSQGKMRKTFSI